MTHTKIDRKIITQAADRYKGGVRKYARHAHIRSMYVIPFLRALEIATWFLSSRANWLSRALLALHLISTNTCQAFYQKYAPGKPSVTLKARAYRFTSLRSQRLQNMYISRYDHKKKKTTKKKKKERISISHKSHKTTACGGHRCVNDQQTGRKYWD